MTALLDTPADAARGLAADLKRRWRRGEPADAARALADHPDLARHKSVVVDLAYEEYLLRELAGDAPEPDAFAGRFTAFRASIRNMLDAHLLLLEQPELLDPAAGDWPEAGAPFEGLDLLAELGRGAFGHAYLAFDPATDRLCVLKLSTGRSAEARVIGRLAHPHVTDVYWARVVGSRTAVCMPFVGASTLADVVSFAFPRPGDPAPPTADAILAAAEADRLAGQADRRSAPVVRPGEPFLVGACAVAARIADAVAYLHGQGVAHGDLKPSNVVIGPGGAPHLIDFNLATGDAALAAVRGTPAYMAPEQLDAAAARAPAAGLDPARADLFSLGAVVVELLTGRLPFPTADGSKSFDALAAAARRPVTALPAALPPAVVAALTACLAADPARRPSSAGELAAALDRYVAGCRGRGRRHLRTAAAVAGLALLAGAASFAIPGRPPATPPVPLHTEKAEEYFNRAMKSLRDGNPTLARADFDATHKLSGNPRHLTFVAYCLALEKQFAASAGVAERAIREGDRSAEAHNLHGFALIEAARPGEAIGPLTAAIDLGPPPGLPAARYNRAIAQMRAAQFAQITVPLEAANDIEATLDAGLRSVGVHFDAARITAACSDRKPELRAVAIEQVRAAIRAGKDPNQCRNDSVLKAHLAGDPDFVAACNTPRGQAPDKPPPLRLVEPLP